MQQILRLFLASTLSYNYTTKCKVFSLCLLPEQTIALGRNVYLTFHHHPKQDLFIIINAATCITEIQIKYNKASIIGSEIHDVSKFSHPTIT